MKILITTEFYLPFRCGVTTAVINQRKALEARGHEVRILTIGKDRNSHFKDNTYYIGSSIPQLYKDSYATLDFNDPYVKEIVEWCPDIVHSQCEFFTMVFAKKVAAKADAPLIHTCHTDFEAYRIHFTNNERLWNFATHYFIPRILRKASFIICPTSKIYDLLKGYCVENPMKVIPVGLDLAHLEQSLSLAERNEIRAKFGFSSDDVLLVSICRLSEEKNVGESIAHFSSLSKIRDNARLLIVGDGTARESLEKQVADLQLSDKVCFAGNIPMDEVWKYYHAGDIFISSSLSEIQGLTYIEALASGLPIVCRNDAALRESMVEGENGFGFDDEEGFLKAILPLIDSVDLRLMISKNARTSVQKYSLESFAASLESIYMYFIEHRSDSRSLKKQNNNIGDNV